MHHFCTFQIEHQPFKSKTSNLVINSENDDVLILNRDQILQTCGINNETEISFFNREDYEQYKKTLTSLI